MRKEPRVQNTFLERAAAFGGPMNGKILNGVGQTQMGRCRKRVAQTTSQGSRSTLASQECGQECGQEWSAGFFLRRE